MRRFFACLFLAIFAIAFLIVGGVYLLSRYAMTLETTEEIELPYSDISLRAPLEDLEVFTPINRKVYTDPSVTLEGKSSAGKVLLVLNASKIVLLSTDGEGRFRTQLTLAKGANKIALSVIGSEARDFTKEIMVGYYPKSGSYSAFVGVSKNVSSENKTLDLIIPIGDIGDDVAVKVAGSTKIFEGRGSQAVSFSAVGSRFGIAMIVPKGGGARVTAEELRIISYPYNFWAHKVVEKLGSSLVVERKRAGGPISYVFPTAGTKIVRWDDRGLFSTSFSSIGVGDRVFVNAHVRPGERQIDFFANFIVVLGR